MHHDRGRGALAHLGLRGGARLLPMDGARFRRLLGKYLGAERASWNGWFVDRVAAVDSP